MLDRTASSLILVKPLASKVIWPLSLSFWNVAMGSFDRLVSFIAFSVAVIVIDGSFQPPTTVLFILPSFISNPTRNTLPSFLAVACRDCCKFAVALYPDSTHSSKDKYLLPVIQSSLISIMMQTATLKSD